MCRKGNRWCPVVREARIRSPAESTDARIDRSLVAIEAKWRSVEGIGQGKDGTKTQDLTEFRYRPHIDEYTPPLPVEGKEFELGGTAPSSTGPVPQPATLPCVTIRDESGGRTFAPVTKEDF